jgi:hypothetical protein
VRKSQSQGRTSVEAKQLTLTEGQRLTLSDDDLEVEGKVHFAEEEHLWVAVIDWDAIRRRSA